VRRGSIGFPLLGLIMIAASAIVLGGCVTTSMQGYADL
jgi:hypothetical protein